MQNHNGRNGGSGFRPQPPSNTGAPYNTPTPQRARAAANNLGTIAEHAPYVPPQRRGVALNDIVRPESSMSNVSFASQAPAPDFGPVNPTLVNRGQLVYPPAGTTLPYGHYAYGPGQLTEQFARYDASLGAAREAPGLQRFLPNSSHGTQGMSGGLNFHNDGVRPGFGNGPGVIGSGMPSNSTIIPAPRTVPNNGSDDSCVGNGKAHHVSRMIREGCAEDPRDVDYGNPGPSKRRDAIYLTIAATPPRRGNVAAAASQEPSPFASPRAPNIRGNSAAYIGVRQDKHPDWLERVQDGVAPNLERVLHDLPLIEACRIAIPTTAGVLRIRNLPFNTSRAEITAFLGRNAQVISMPVGTPFLAIHVIMDRLSGKTLDAFIEVETPHEAKIIAQQFARRIQQGRGCKIGDRPVLVEQSSQQLMMHELFPRAKTVVWVGSEPKFNTEYIEYFYDGVASVGFDGYLFGEDYAHMIKHVEMPSRSPFVNKCLVRPYDSLITTIHKFPWFDVEHVLVSERDYFFLVVIKSIDALMNLLKQIGGHGGHDPTKPNSTTLKELTIAALTCPGFTEMQKAKVIRHLNDGNFGQYTTNKGLGIRFGGTDSYSAVWPFKALVKKPGVSDELVEYITGLLRDATQGDQLSLADLHAMQHTGNLANPFGSLDIDYEGCRTLADVGRLELKTIEKLLTYLLPRARDQNARDQRTLALGYDRGGVGEDTGNVRFA